MAILEINPTYAALLSQLQLARVEQFLALPGVVVSGHPDRHVVHVALGNLTAFLKREHRVPLRERLASACAGYGFRSRSVREAHALRELRAVGIGCPDWIAAGEDNRGRAFLLVRELSGAVALPKYLRGQASTPRARRRVARRLGQALAQLHAAGYLHGDLYSKHVLIDETTISWLDWPRVRRRAALPWRERCRDLAALHATLAGSLASRRERLLCLRTYLRACGLEEPVRVGDVERHAARLERRRYVREMRDPAPAVVHRLIWLDGEALCVTPQFQEKWKGPLPQSMLLKESTTDAGIPQQIKLPNGSQATLVRRDEARFFSSLWGLFHARSHDAPEVCQAALLFRLERHGLLAPRLLAFGQWAPAWNRRRSFLLAEEVQATRSVAAWSAHSVEQTSLRWRVLREIGTFLRRFHRAGLAFDPPRTQGKALLCFTESQGTPLPALGCVDGITLTRRLPSRHVEADLIAACRESAPLLHSRTDRLRLVLAYLGTPRLTAEGRRLLRRLLSAPPLDSVPDLDGAQLGRPSPRPVALV